MRLVYPHNPTHPITSTEAYLRRRSMALENQAWREFSRSLPHIQNSRCPYNPSRGKPSTDIMPTKMNWQEIRSHYP